MIDIVALVAGCFFNLGVTNADGLGLVRKLVTCSYNAQRKVSEHEIIDQLTWICEELERTEGIPQRDTFAVAYDTKKYFFHDREYLANLCPKRFLSREKTGDSFDIEQKTGILPKTLEEAVTLAVQARDEGKPYGEYFAAKDPESGKRFHELIQQPEAFLEAFPQGANLQALLKYAKEPKSPREVRGEGVKQTVSAENSGSIFTDEDGLKQRHFVIKKDGKFVKCEVEFLCCCCFW